MMKIVRIALLIVVFSLTLPAAADETYISTLEGTFVGEYDADPNGVCPDWTGYGMFLCGGADFFVNLNYPDPVEGFFDWYAYVDFFATGMLLSQVPIGLNINADGVAFWMWDELAYMASWAELGFVWMDPYGLYLGEYATPPEIWPPNADAILGNWTYDYDGGGDDFGINIAEDGEGYEAEGCMFRSISWLASTGTGIPNVLADFLEAYVDGMDASWLRAVDLGPLVMVDETIIDFGGPIPGADATANGGYFVQLTAHRGSTAVGETSWGALKSLY